MCAIRTFDERSSIFIFSSEKILYKDYDLKGSVEEKNSVRESQGAWRQDELIGGKPPVVK
jgi:hypothetical protein